MKRENSQFFLWQKIVELKIVKNIHLQKKKDSWKDISEGKKRVDFLKRKEEEDRNEIDDNTIFKSRGSKRWN